MDDDPQLRLGRRGAVDDDRAAVMGLSMGGMIAQEVALQAPDRVAGLALVATRPPTPRFVQPLMMSTLSLVRPLMPGETLPVYFGRLWSSAAARRQPVRCHHRRPRTPDRDRDPPKRGNTGRDQLT